jgi:Xaa-Pro aminopeptidase
VIVAQAGGRKYLAVSSLEYGRAEKQARVDELLSFEELEVERLTKELKSGGRALAAASASLLQKLGAHEAAVPPSMAVIYADELRARGIDINPEAEVFIGLRRTKTEQEISYIERTQRATEGACARAVEVLREAKVEADSTLKWGRDPLTSELLRAEIDIELLRHGCADEAGAIVAGGDQTSDPHEKGYGVLHTGEPIILDIFPVDRDTRYYADMTRTVVKGEPSPELEKMYEAVLAAQRAALESIGAGVNGREIHLEVSEMLHEAGYKTVKHDREEGKPLREGFMHGTGHGVGIDIHEAPRLSMVEEELKAGDVVTVEPGLYYPETGGVRIEDLVVVTEDGCRNLTEFPKELRL